jgi:hypothetical protein
MKSKKEIMEIESRHRMKVIEGGGTYGEIYN